MKLTNKDRSLSYGYRFFAIAWRYSRRAFLYSRRVFFYSRTVIFYCCTVIFYSSTVFSSHALFADERQPTAPQRIASFNICIDQLLWELVPHEHLVSLSYLTADPMWSAIAGEVQQMPLNHGLAEEIIPLRPDIVLAGDFDTPDAVNLLQRLGVNVVRLSLPRVLDDLAQQVITLGDLVGAKAEAANMAAHIQQELKNLADVPQGPRRLTAIWYSSNGVVIGDGTLENELMHLAGLRNLAAEKGLYGFNPLDLELLLAAKPDVLIIEESNAEAFSLAREYLSHPALENAHFTIIRLPAGLSGCAARVVGDVTGALKSALEQQH